MDSGSISVMEVASVGNVGGAGSSSAPSQFPGAHSAPQEPPSSSSAYAILGPPLAQVMTDEQLETLRRQIFVYATICQQLVEMHKATMAQQNGISGSRFGQSSSCDSGLHSLGQRFASRQRWTPSQMQLQILEKLFQQGTGTPSKQRIKEISLELGQYGPISETNVYNWFQNRRARTKRKQQLGASNCMELDFDTDVDFQEEKRARAEKELPIVSDQHNPSFQNWEQVELQLPNIAQNGLQCFQRQATAENLTSPYSKAEGTGASASMFDRKPDSIGASVLHRETHVEGTARS